MHLNRSHCGAVTQLIGMLALIATMVALTATAGVEVGNREPPPLIISQPTTQTQPARLAGRSGQMQLDSEPETGGTNTCNETEASAKIRALARGLEYDPKLIYEHVRNHIEYDPPTYGLMNGANGCLLAGRGNDWDQAALLVSLLRVSGYKP